MSKLVSIKQAEILKELGFTEITQRYAYKSINGNKFKLAENIGRNYRYNKPRFSGFLQLYLLVPTVDQAIDWIRRKFDVIIYNSAEPFVTPLSKDIVYAYGVKYCSKRDGWNGRIIIERSGDWCKDPNTAKRRALTKALNFIKKEKDAKRRRKSENRQKRV
jgi:hypothetical protein